MSFTRSARAALAAAWHWATPQHPPPWRTLLVIVVVAHAIQAACPPAQQPTVTVYREWPSLRCRAVVTHDTDTLGDCGRLPPVHATVWVGEEWGGPR